MQLIKANEQIRNACICVVGALVLVLLALPWQDIAAARKALAASPANTAVESVLIDR